MIAIALARGAFTPYMDVMVMNGLQSPVPLGAVDPSEADSERTERLAREQRQVAQALASVAAGRTVPFAAVEAWVESWDSADELPMPRSGR